MVSQNVVIFSIAIVLAAGLFVFGPSLMKPAPVGGQAFQSAGSPCYTSTGIQGIYDVRGVCVSLQGGVPSTTVPTSATATAVPAIPTPKLVCTSNDGKVSYLTEVLDSLDYEASGTTNIGSVTIYLTKSGAKVYKATSSSSGSVELTMQCEKGKVGFIAVDDDNSGDDIYPVDSAELTYISGTLAGQKKTYSGETVPTYYTTVDRVPKGFVDAPVVMNAQIQGNLSLTLWDDSGTVTDKNLSLVTYSGVTNSYAKFLIQEIDKDEAAQGITILIDYNTQNITDIGITPSSGSVKEDKGVIPSYFSSYDTAFRLYSDTAGTVPLTLDGSKLTPSVPNQMSGSIDIERASTATGGENITVRVIDTMRYLEAGSYTWAGNGAYYSEDSQNTNLGIQSGDEPHSDLILTYS